MASHTPMPPAGSYPASANPAQCAPEGVVSFVAGQGQGAMGLDASSVSTKVATTPLCLRCIEKHCLATSIRIERIEQGACAVCRRTARVAVVRRQLAAQQSME